MSSSGEKAGLNGLGHVDLVVAVAQLSEDVSREVGVVSLEHMLKILIWESSPGVVILVVHVRELCRPHTDTNSFIHSLIHPTPIIEHRLCVRHCTTH